MTSSDERFDRWTDRLSAYLDGELAPAKRDALERHLEECRECVRTLEELQAVVRRARNLEPAEPPRDLWPEIAARIEADELGLAGAQEWPDRTAEAGSAPLSLEDARERRSGRRLFTLSLPQLAAAAVVLMALSGGGAWLASSGGPGAPISSTPGIAGAGPGTAASFATARGPMGAEGSTLARYQAAIAELETALFRDGERLDTATVRKIRESLLIIDRAIEEARRALREDPADPYVHQHLAETMRRKMEFLQQTAVLAVARG